MIRKHTRLIISIYHIMEGVIDAIKLSDKLGIRLPQNLIKMQIRSKHELFSQNSMHVMRVLKRSLTIDNVVGSFQVLCFYRIKYRTKSVRVNLSRIRILEIIAWFSKHFKLFSSLVKKI